MYYDDYYEPYEDDGYADYIASLYEDGEGFCDYHDSRYPLTPSEEKDKWGCPKSYEDPGCPKCAAVKDLHQRIAEGEVSPDAICYACEGSEADTSFLGRKVCSECYDAIRHGKYRADRCSFADPGGRSALRAAGPGNPRVHPCGNCGEPNRLTPQDLARGYQCDTCADRAEGIYRGGDY